MIDNVIIERARKRVNGNIVLRNYRSVTLILVSCTGQRQKYAVVIEERLYFMHDAAIDAISFMRRQWDADLATPLNRRFSERIYVTANNLYYIYKFHHWEIFLK